MDIMPLARSLSLPAMTLQALETIVLPDNHEALREMYMHEDFLHFRQAAQELDDLTMLCLLLSWVPCMHAQYQALGIPEHIFRDNLKDFTIWSHDDVNKTGHPGFSHWRWVARSLRMNIIRLGRLQFERTTLSEDVFLEGTIYPAGTPVLAVHIPAGEPLEPAAVLDAFARAQDFFPHYLDAHDRLLHCHTWLLAPELNDLLPSSSRILQFQRLFHVYAHNDAHQAEERVFGSVLDDPALYPAHTSLQKALKAYLLSGGKVGAGAGVRIL